ncbi:hypothetical protein [Rhodococcus sp. T2V]|nr:hypothetical protein [Rhodococcus sp. T2V]
MNRPRDLKRYPGLVSWSPPAPGSADLVMGDVAGAAIRLHDWDVD